MRTPAGHLARHMTAWQPLLRGELEYAGQEKHPEGHHTWLKSEVHSRPSVSVRGGKLITAMVPSSEGRLNDGIGDMLELREKDLMN